MTITRPGLYPELTNEQYHADPVEGGSLSASGAKTILKAPAKFHYQRSHPVYKNEFDFGSVAHALALGDNTVSIDVLDFKDRRTAGYKAAEEAAREAGSVPILKKDYAVIEDMVTALHANQDAMDLLSIPGKPEQSAFWKDERTGIWRRARFDRLPSSDSPIFALVDYKTAASSDPDKFAKAAADFGYHMQAAWYCDAVRALDLHADPAFVFVVQEKEPPYIVTVIQLTEAATDLGSRQNAKAIDRYIECTTSGIWPGYVEGVTHIELPGYYMNTEEEKIT
jgi:hypothetical protein